MPDARLQIAAPLQLIKRIIGQLQILQHHDNVARNSLDSEQLRCRYRSCWL
jgi:hypothetical protein